MAACDIAQYVTSGAPYTTAALGGIHNQKALLAWAMMATTNKQAVVDQKLKITQVQSKLGAIADDQIRAGFISMIVGVISRNGFTVPTPASAQIAFASYLYPLDDHLLDKIFMDALCELLATAIP